tara:strand:+ start:251 stop:619 length:369 start_codon:yes stop_codon:yes gene_type:complete
MKNFIKILFPSILMSSFLFSEEYICSKELSYIGRDGEVEVKTYEREKNRFIKYSKNGKSYFDILHETETFIILTQTYPYPSLFVVFIDKEKNTFLENYLKMYENEWYEYKKDNVIGTCVVKN